MNKNFWSEKISEEKISKFIEDTLGVCPEMVVKFFDEAYCDYIFRVTVPYGLDFLPKDDFGNFRLGRFGFVKDNEESVLPVVEDDFGINQKLPNFVRSYLSFMAHENKGYTVNGKTYERDFEDRYTWFMIADRNKKIKQAEEDLKNNKSLLSFLKSKVKEEEEEKE